MPLFAAEPPLLQVDVGWTLGALRSAQTAADDASGPLYPTPLSQGWDGDASRAQGLGLDATLRLGDRLGVAARGLDLRYEEELQSPGELPAPSAERRARTEGSLALLLRRELGLGPVWLEPNVQLGVWGGSLVLHGLHAGEDGGLEPEVYQAWSGGPMLGAGAALGLGERWELSATLSIGAGPDLRPAWTGYGLDLRRGLVLGLYGVAGLQWSSRALELYGEDGAAGAVEDQLGILRLGIGYAI